MSRPRKYPPAKVGDQFGPYTVTALLPRGFKGRSDERVEWRCTCGRWGASFVFNLRSVNSTCNHETPEGATTAYGHRFPKSRRAARASRHEETVG